MKSNRRYLAGVVPASALVGGISTFFILGGTVHTPVSAQDTVALTAEQRTTATALEGAFMRIADTAGPATVRIKSVSAPQQQSVRRLGGVDSSGDGGDGGDAFPFGQFFSGPGGGGAGAAPPRMPRSTSFGSGAIIRPDGWIITNDHVVEDAEGGKVTVYLSDNSEYIGKVYRDTTSDLAVIKIDAGKPLPWVKLADTVAPRVGQWAIAIGSPFSQQNTMTTGIVSALHRNRQIPDGSTPRYYTDLIQTDAAINPGNSGGPLLNINGELIGVNVAILSDSGRSAGIGFAIPASTARIVADQLIAKGKVTRSSLGVVPKDIPPILRSRLGTSKGAYVDQIASDAPADKAGIEPGDVITKFGDREVTDEIGLRNAIATAAPGTTVPITLLRSGKAVQVRATLIQREEPRGSEGGGAGSVSPTLPARRPANEVGINARPLTPKALESLGLPATTKGVLVNAVTEGSPAAEAGLERGMVILSVNGKPVIGVDELNTALHGIKSNDVVTLAVLSAADEGKSFKSVYNLQIP